MERRDVRVGDPKLQSFATQARPGLLRFRTESEPGGDPMRRRWQAVYSYGEGWARFQIAMNLGRNTLTLFRTLEADYTAMLRDLADKPMGSLTPIPPPSPKVESLSFDVELIGLKMTRVNAGAFQEGPAGEWLVVQAYVPRSAESFLVGVNDKLNAGEIVIPNIDSAPIVVHALMQVFG